MQADRQSIQAGKQASKLADRMNGKLLANVTAAVAGDVCLHAFLFASFLACLLNCLHVLCMPIGFCLSVCCRMLSGDVCVFVVGSRQTAWQCVCVSCTAELTYSTTGARAHGH